MKFTGLLLLPPFLLAGFFVVRRPAPAGSVQTSVETGTEAEDEDEVYGPREEPVDEFHPEPETLGPPAYGGTVTVHLNSMPRDLNYALHNWATARHMLHELHEYLVQRDWETWQFKPVLARDWVTEDALYLTSGETFFGRVAESSKQWELTPVSSSNPLQEKRAWAKDRCVPAD